VTVQAHSVQSVQIWPEKCASFDKLTQVLPHDLPQPRIQPHPATTCILTSLCSVWMSHHKNHRNTPHTLVAPEWSEADPGAWHGAPYSLRRRVRFAKGGKRPPRGSPSRSLQAEEGSST